jgi:hypothetical protein
MPADGDGVPVRRTMANAVREASEKPVMRFVASQPRRSLLPERRLPPLVIKVRSIGCQDRAKIASSRIAVQRQELKGE